VVVLAVLFHIMSYHTNFFEGFFILFYFFMKKLRAFVVDSCSVLR